ncbi:MAG TPA: family 43 glycosylhydrolase [Verrucomicrobiae bacterium]|nr:family 43 glycosylhydrolase [Verrucomicrobiae bacterium]
MPFYGNYYLHDPGTMIKDDGNYFIYGDGQGISGMKSSDLRNWSGTGAVFPNGPPAWTSNSVPGFTGYFWAPDIAYFNGRYNLYYACSDWGTINSAIGLVTSPSLTSPVWTDQGKVIQSNPNFATNATTDLTAYNCIDPSILVDNDGSVWMAFGSYSDGILIMQLDPATGKRISPGSPIYRVSNNGPVFFSNTEEGSCLYRHGNYYYLFVNFGGCCAGADSTYNIRVGRSTSVSGPYLDKNGINMINGGGTMLLESTGRFIGPGHAAIMNDNGTNWFTYHYYDGNNYGIATVGMNRIYWTDDGWPSITNDWSAFYPFDLDARDHSGLYNGTMQNGASITSEPERDSTAAGLYLDGNINYVSLANPVANASTFAAWVKWNGGDDWQRIFDFGSNTTKYFFLTPRASTGQMRFAITSNGNTHEQQIDAPTALPTNSWCHVAVTLDGSQGILYLNAIPVATNAVTIRPWQLLCKSNFLGKSQFSTDPYFNGEIDSFRVFGRALSPQEIRDVAYAHPALAHRYSFNTNTNVAWDSIGMAHGTLMGNAIITNGALELPGASGSYVNLPGGLVSGSSAVTIEFWATFGANGDWARVFDFGNISGSSGTQYFFFSPHTSLGGQRMEIKNNTAVTVDVPGILDHRTVFVTCIVDPTNNYAAIYTNAVLEQAMAASWPKFNSVSTAWSFLGRSLFSSDAWLNGSIDEFRIYDGRLTPRQIAVDYQFGPNELALPVSVSVSNSPANTTVSWPAWAIGFTPQFSDDLSASAWTSVTQSPTLSADQWLLTIPKTNAAKFFRLQR